MIGASRAASTREYQLLSTTTITSTGAQSFTVPSGVVFLEVEMYGGGGGGGKGTAIVGRGSTQHTRGGGGGGGAYVRHRIRIADLRKDDTINFTVGSGGSSGTSLSDPGNDGGDTTLDTHKRSSSTITTFSNITAGGGEGGKSASTFSFGGNFSGGGEASGGNITNTNGSDGEESNFQSSAFNGGNGGDAGGPDGGDGGNGGTAASLGVLAGSGFAPGGGGGGGGSTINTAGANGGTGKVIIKAFG